MARDSFDESKNTKKKVTKKKTEEKKPQSSSVTKPKTTTTKADKVASKSTFLGGGAPVQKVEQAASKPTTVKKPANTKKQTVTKQDQINQKMYGTTKPNVTTKTQRTKRDTSPVTSSQRQKNAEANMNLKQRNIRDTTPVQSRRTATTTAAQRQKMGMPTQQDLQDARASRRELANSVRSSVREATSETNKGFMQRQKSGTLTTSDKKRIEKTNQRRAEVARNTRDVAKKAVIDTGSGYAQSIYDLTELTAGNKNGTQAKAMKMGLDPNRDRRQIAKLEREQKYTAAESKRRRDELFQKQEQRQAEWDERTKNAKGLEKAWYGAVESGTGMVADTLVGAATGTGQFGALASMGLRTYGPSANQARKEGATDKEARLYGLAQSAKEVGTELMFQGAGLAKAAYGKTGLSLADKSANILTRGLTGLKADAVGAGVRALGGTAEENIEELAGWMADPLIKELTYGKAVRNRMKENLRANIPQIGSDADVAHVASYFSTPKFTDDLTNEYVKSGMSRDKASSLAAEMRDYYVAYYSGDKGRLDALEEDLAAKLSGQDKLSFRSWSMDELKDTFASTTLLTLATGLPGAVTTSVKGNQIFDSDEVKAVFGNDAVRKVADAVKNTSNKEMSLKAETMEDRLKSGKDLTGTQKYDLYQGYIEKVNETSKKARASQGVVENARREQNLVPTMGVDRAGNTVYAKETQREYDEKYAETAVTAESLRRFMESDNSISDDEIRRTDAAIKAVSDLHVGGLTIGDAHEFAYGNNLARETLKIEEGIDLDKYIVRKADGTVDLAATNEATENALFRINADNAIKAAQAETEVFIDDTRGNIDKDLLTRFGNNGQAVWKEVNKDLDPRNLQEYLTNANAASYFYSAGRNTDMSVDTAVNRFADTFKTVDKSVMKRAFAAGARDRIIANTPGYGQTVESGSNIPLKKTEPVITGQLIMDDDVVLADSDQSAYLALAMSTNTNIHIVSNLNAMGKDGKPIINQATGLPVQLNGMSHGNDIYLSMNEASEKNLGYVFMHEMTHQIKQYAPNEYLALENLVRDKWFNKDATGMQAAIKQRMDLYSVKGGQQLTEEEAVEEIIADAMAEAMDDPNFAAEVCEQDINLGEKILESIRGALRSIRQIFANSDFKNDRFHNSLLSYLGILDEAEKMWLNALATAKQNKADGLIADWQDKANKQNSPRLSVGEGKYSITTDKEDFIKGANLSKNLRDWAKEMGLDKLSKQPIKGPVIVSVRDLRTAWYEKNGRSDEANVINTALDKIGDSLTQLVGKYQYIDLGDALNAAVTYRTDAEGNPTSVILSCQVKNAEYEVNFDFTTICAKRLAMQKILERFIKTEGERQGTTLYDELKLDEEGLYKLRLILETAGFDVSCRGCFVEQNRYSQQNQARTIANDWNAALDDWARENGTEVTENFGLTTLDIDNLDYEEIEAGFERYHELMKGKKTDVATKNRMLIESSPFFRKRMNASDYASMTGQRALMAIGESKKGGTNLYGLLKRGQSDSKQSVPFTAYNGEISLLPDNMKGKSLYDYLLSIGGARAQSASDFQIEFVYDYMQMVADLSARGLPMHMYTKVIELAELFGMTGIKINLSAMCDVAEDVGGEYAGLKLVDGKYEYNISDQSIDYPKAVELQKRDGYSKNIGIIMVTLSSQHMLKSLDDPDVRYIIGYHSSAMPVVVANMSNMGGATDYTKINKTNKLNEKGQALFDEAMAEAKGNTELEKYKDALRIFDEKIQEETAKKKKKPRRGNEYGAYMSAYGNNTADFNTYDNLLETKDARKTADKYLEHCMENGLIPIYFPFAFHENYYKCEVYDFNMYDNNTGEYAPMEGVQNIYPGLNMAAGETDTTAFTDRVSQMMDAQNRTNKALDSQYDAVFDEAKNTLKYSITGDDYMDFDASGIDHNELTHRADAPMTAEQQRDADYMAAVESGDMETAQRMVDEAARMAMPNTKLKGRWYHGTENEFTEFNFSQGGKNGTADGFGIYLTNDPEVASSYGNRMIEGYVNVTRPASALTSQTLTDIELHRLISRTVDVEAETLMYDEGYDNAGDAKKDTWISNYTNTYEASSLDQAIDDVIKTITQFNGNDFDIIQEIMNGMGIRDYEQATAFYDILTEETGIDGLETKWGDESEMADPNTPTIALAFRSNQIKDSSPVTYDDEGNAIPLSERFDPTNNDIRYSLPTQDSNGNILTDGQMEYFKNSQARDIFGRLVPLYHATDEGGFTIFDPWKSDDHRSLFFSSRRDVAKTYAYNGGNAFDFAPKKLNSWNDLIQYGRQLFSDADMSWDDDTDDNNLDFELYDKQTGDWADIDYDEWLDLANSNDPHADDYRVRISLPYNNKDGETETISFEGDSMEDLLNNVANGNIPHGGHYQVYLNLENPLIIEGHGQPWNDIVDGGATFPSYSYVTLKKASWFREEAERRDEMYGLGQSLYNGDKDRARADEFESDDFVEIEIFDGQKKIKNIIPIDEEVIADELAAAFGIDDIEIVEGIANELAGDMSWQNFSKFYGDDMRNTIGEYGYDTREWAEFAEDEGYDGVIFRNIVDIDDKSEIDEDDTISDIYIAFSSNQVKDINNENPTENPDIRFSIPSEEEVTAYALDMAESTSDVWYTDPVLLNNTVRYSMSEKDFKNRVKSEWNERWETRGLILDEASVQNDVRNLVKTIMKNSEVNKKYDADVTKKATKAVTDIFKLFKSGKLEEAASYAWDAAEDIVQNVEYVEDDMYQKYKGVITYLADTKIAAPEALMDDEEFSAFVMENLRKFLVKNKGEDISNVYTHLNTSWPKLFPKLDHPVDMFLQIAEVMDEIQPYTEVYSSEEAAKLTEDTAAALVDIAKSGEAYKSAADIMNPVFDRETKALKQRHKEAMSKVRTRRDELIQNEKGRTARQKERADKWKQKYNDRIQKDKVKREEKKERQTHQKLYNKTLKEYKDLTHKLLHPTKDKAKNVPEQLRQPLAHLLYCFDLEKERSKELEEMYMLPTRAQLNFRELKDAMDKVIKEDPTAYELSDVQRYMADKMVGLADRVDGKTIDALDNEDLDTIADLLKGISEGIKNGQQLEIDGENYEKQQQCDKVGAGAYEHQKLYGKAKKYGSNEEPGIRALADHIVNMGELTPIYFFRQIKGIYDMYRQMRKGFDNYVRNEKDIIDKIADILAPYYKTNRKKQRIQGSEIEEWRTLESAETFDLITANQKITLTIAQKMSLYCLAKRKQAQAHMFSENGGVIASEASFGSRMHKAEEKYKGKEIEYKSVVLTPADIETITSTLTEEQKEIADSLQKLMSVDMSELGNKASVKLTGIEMYKEKEYFPIKVQGESLPTDPENIGIREKIRNPGFSNPLQENASNPIIVDDIFTVVASHCNEMNQYASYAVPITNFMKVYNGSVIGEDGKPVKIKTLLKETYGEKALTYIENFIDDINGNSFKRHGGLDDVLDKALGQAKKAAVFANLRVALQQPTAIIRAFAVMKVKYFKGVKPSAAATQEMFEHCPIALWKSWGYYDTHFGRDIEDVMMGKNQPSKMDYIMSEAYGWFDNMTWGMIWQAVKNEVRENNPNVEEGSEEFWELCNERASFVFDSTQVVDSPFHRSNDMRSKNGLVKQLTSFQAEPTLSFNVLRQGFVDAYEALKKGDSKKARRLLERVFMVWVAQALTVALAQSFVDALRRKGKKKKDEEEDEMLAWYQELYKYFLRNFGNNLKDDLNPINNIYFIKDIVPPILNAIKGEYVYGTQSLTTQWVDTLTNGISMCKKKWEKGEADYHTWYDCLTELMGGIGYLAGVPAKTMMRGTKNAFHWVGKILGVNVFADDGEAVDKAVDAFVDNFRGDETESEGGGLLDSIAHKMGYQKKGDKDVASEPTSENTMSPDDLPDNLTDEQKADIIKSAERRSKTATAAEDVEKRDYDTMLYDAMKAASGYEGEKYNKKIWESVSKGYKAYVEEGNYERINMMRRVVEEAGGDLDYFDKQVNEASKTALKKSIKSASDMTEEEYYAQKSILGHLRQSGMTDGEISEYIYKSDTRTDLQVAMRINDEDAIFEELTALVNVGFTQQDFEKAYKNRNRVNLKNYKDKGGKYADRLKSMGKFIWPTDGVITSHFGYRNAPTAGASSNHPAIDIGAPQGTAVVAADGGVVISAGANGGYGNSVGIKHDNGMITWYNHLYDWNVKVGDTVAQGQQIAQVGSTGISTGPHLDFKIMDTNGNPVDPEKYLATR